MNLIDNKFLNELNIINTKPTNLSDSELAKLEENVFSKIAINNNKTLKSNITTIKQYPRNYKFSIIRKIGVGLASCLILAVFFNITSPAFAEQLPLIGDLFAWFNNNTISQLKSDSLGEFSEDVYLTPSSSIQEEQNSQENTVIAQSSNSTKFVITQIYCDSLYLRLAVQLTVNDSSLSEFEYLSIDPYTGEPKASNLNGSVYINGQEVFLDSSFTRLEKKDGNTFIGNLTYKLQTVTTQITPYSTQIEALSQDVTKPFTATLQINNINGYTGNYVYNKEDQLNEHETVCVLDDTLTFEIDVTPNLSSNRIYNEEAMQNGIIIENIAATPGETEIKYFVPKEFNNPAITLETSKGLRLYPLGGYVEFTDDGEWTTMAFDAVPIDIDEVKICFIDKNNDDNILAEFNCLLE